MTDEFSLLKRNPQSTPEHEGYPVAGSPSTSDQRLLPISNNITMTQSIIMTTPMNHNGNVSHPHHSIDNSTTPLSLTALNASRSGINIVSNSTTINNISNSNIILANNSISPNIVINNINNNNNTSDPISSSNSMMKNSSDINDLSNRLEVHSEHSEHNELTNYNNSHKICGREWIRSKAWRIRQSVPYFLIYLVLIILNAFVLLWEVLAGEHDKKIMIILEGIITLMFVSEVLVEVITQEWTNYWSSWMNRLDFIVCILCFILFLMFAIVEEAPHSHYNIESYVDAIIVGIRYGIQAIRFVRFAHKGRQNRHMLDPDNVVFDSNVTLSVLSEHDITNPNNSNINENNNNNNNNNENNSNTEMTAAQPIKLSKFKKLSNKLRSKAKKTNKYQTIEMISIDDTDESVSHTHTRSRSHSLDLENAHSNGLVTSSNGNHKTNGNLPKLSNVGNGNLSGMSIQSIQSIQSNNSNISNISNRSNNSHGTSVTSVTSVTNRTIGDSPNDTATSLSGDKFDRARMEELMVSHHDVEQTEVYQSIISNDHIVSSDDDYVKRQLLKTKK